MGEHIALMGPSGCGKSTLIRLLLGFAEPSSGILYYKGVKLNLKNLPKLRQEAGVLFQEPSFIGKSVREAILFPFTFSLNRKYKPSDELIVLKLKEVGLDNLILDQDIGNLSGGEKQRLVLVRILLLNSKFIVADEPTSALDGKSTENIITSLLASDRTAVIVTHDERVAAKCQRIVRMEKGAIIKEEINGDR